jgi:hypothetical protein
VEQEWWVDFITMKYIVTKKPLLLPFDILDMYESEYYAHHMDDDDSWTEERIQSLLDLRIQVYKESRTESGEILVCAHPNYGGAGPVYDFAIIPGKIGEEESEGNEDTNESHIGDSYPNHVPCRVLSFYTDPIDGVEKAFVHRCHIRSNWNKQRDSVLIELWTVETTRSNWYLTNTGEYHQDKKRAKNCELFTRLCPLYRQIPAKTIVDGIWAIPDSDVFQDFSIPRKDTFHVMVVKDRDKYWAHEFLV